MREREYLRFERQILRGELGDEEKPKGYVTHTELCRCEWCKLTGHVREEVA